MTIQAIAKTIDHINECEKMGLDPFDTDCYSPKSVLLADTLILGCFVQTGHDFKNWQCVSRYHATLNL